MLASERTADGEIAVCKGKTEWTPEGRPKSRNAY